MEKKNVLALQVIAPRHPMMEGEESEKYLSLKKEMVLDAEIGLKNQMSIEAMKILNHDIETLTKSNDYHLVTDDMLKKLFEFKNLQFKCIPFNLIQKLQSFFSVFKYTLLLLVSFVIFLYTFPQYVQWYNSVSDLGIADKIRSMLCFLVLSVIGFLNLVGLFFAHGRKPTEEESKEWDRQNSDKLEKVTVLNYVQMSVTLLKESIDDTLMHIPRGAKLKLLEAKKTGIFENFLIIRPKIILRKKTVVLDRKIKAPFNVDPAIVGVVKGAQYMVVSWDIKKDIEKTVKSLKQLKKYKLKGLYQYEEYEEIANLD